MTKHQVEEALKITEEIFQFQSEGHCDDMYPHEVLKMILDQWDDEDAEMIVGAIKRLS